jgi:hypothetical protein
MTTTTKGPSRMNHKGLLIGAIVLATSTGCSTAKVDGATLQKALVKQGMSVGEASCVADKLSSELTPAEFQKAALANTADELNKSLGEKKAAEVTRVVVACVSPGGTVPDTISDTGPTDPNPSVTTPAQAVVDATSPATAPAEPTTTRPATRPDVPLNTAADVTNGWTVTAQGYDADATGAVMAANEFNAAPPAGQRYITIRLSATFVGRADAQKSTVSDLSLRAVGAKGVAYNSYDCSASLATPLETFTDVFTGATVEGDVCFLIDDSDAESLRLYIETYDSHLDDTTTFFSLR